MIEKDIEKIKTAHTRIGKDLKAIAVWQLAHQKLDDANQAAILEHFGNLPTSDAITDAITRTIQVVVNGKIDKANQSIEEMKQHLVLQDENLVTLSNKIKPFDSVKVWFADFGRGIVYVGALALAIEGIYQACKLFGIIK